ncbi:MAG TPA: hypothetical protein VFY66_05760, partial [Anaerolineales bacterium]|nr:hypothetical protein [Anaerolineales bacterium]
NFNKFVDMNGYEFSTGFVNFAVSEFGPEVIHRMAKYPDDYDRVFNASREEIWQQWMEYLSAKYSMPATFTLPLSEDIHQTLQERRVGFLYLI